MYQRGKRRMTTPCSLYRYMALARELPLEAARVDFSLYRNCIAMELRRSKKLQNQLYEEVYKLSGRQ